jgi:hypothetical protein
MIPNPIYWIGIKPFERAGWIDSPDSTEPEGETGPEGDTGGTDSSNQTTDEMGFFPRQAKANILYGTFGLAVVLVFFAIWKVS